MGEMDIATRDRLLDVFAREYNQAHGTAFRFDTQEPESDGSCDYLLRDGTDSLKIQHVRALNDPTDPFADRAYQNQVDRDVIAPLRRLLLERGLTGLRIAFNVHGLPRGRDARRRLPVALADLARHAVQSHAPTDGVRRLLRFREDALVYWGLVSESVSNVDVSMVDGLTGRPSLLEYSPTRAELRFNPLTDTATSALATVEKKAALLGRSGSDLVLLVHYDVDPYREEELQRIKDSLADYVFPFQEVWIAHDFIPGPAAHPVYAREAPRRPAGEESAQQRSSMAVELPRRCAAIDLPGGPSDLMGEVSKKQGEP